MPRPLAPTFPTVVFGPGSIAQAHTADEWVALDKVQAASEILYRFAKIERPNVSQDQTKSPRQDWRGRLRMFASPSAFGVNRSARLA